MSTDGKHESFAVLAVCTANQCRSPVIEHLLRKAAHHRGMNWHVTSAGTRAPDGAEMHPFAAEVLIERGAAATSWATQQLTRRMVERSDLIVTAQAAHRSAVLHMSPGAVRRTFTLLELAALLELDRTHGTPTAGRGTSVLARATSARALPHRRDPLLFELSDPIDRPLQTFRAMADRIQSAVTHIVP